MAGPSFVRLPPQTALRRSDIRELAKERSLPAASDFATSLSLSEAALAIRLALDMMFEGSEHTN